MKRDAEEKQGKQCIAEQSEGIAKKRRARQGQSIEKLCFARAEDFSYKGAMGKEEICNMDCLHCVHPDCINERPMTRQARYYWRHRDRLLAEKREKYRRKKNELEGLPERKE